MEFEKGKNEVMMSLEKKSKEKVMHFHDVLPVALYEQHLDQGEPNESYPRKRECEQVLALEESNRFFTTRLNESTEMVKNGCCAVPNDYHKAVEEQAVVLKQL